MLQPPVNIEQDDIASLRLVVPEGEFAPACLAQFESAALVKAIREVNGHA